MTQQAVDNRQKLYGIRGKLISGQITYEQAKAEAEPVIKAINQRAKEIAKKHGRRPAYVNFGGIMR